ncbi:MAG TPA: VOC family protein [Stellaceae bacterium]|jgi:catechol 2,3-dioxygenase-like lactoylglutathione lyase family enzyme
MDGTSKIGGKYNVGGVLLDRPFKIRRLGHFGYNVYKMDEALHFYHDLLGFRFTDTLDFARIRPDGAKIFEGISAVGYFTTHGSDHHSFVLFPKAALDRMGRGSAGGHVTNAEVTTNQITWQVGTLREVGDGIDYFKSIGINPGRVGRDVPGSNWHSYPSDPEGHTNEIYYGIEQIGWNLQSKPPAVRKRGFHEKPDLPQISEYQEIEMFKAEGMDMNSGMRNTETLPFKYDVGGVLLPRPFKVIKIGPVRLFVDDLEKCLAFYTDILGLRVTEEVVYEGHRCVFLRCNTEHHSIALYPKALRAKLGLSPHTSCMSFGNQVGDYKQLRDAVDFLKANGATIKYLPPELFPGMDYTAFAVDPDGHTIQLYYYMEQVGWDARVRPPAERRKIDNKNWPATVEAQSDTFDGETLLGPLG